MLLNYIITDTPTTNTQDSLKAITDTLQAIFGASSQQQPINPAKRTLLKRSGGQIMTEKDVIDQLQEQRKKRTKQSHPIGQKSNDTKRRKAQTNGMFRGNLSRISIIECTFF